MNMCDCVVHTYIHICVCVCRFGSFHVAVCMHIIIIII